jgi:hypothetical protein
MANFERRQGGSLVDGEWKHGGSDAEIFKAIAQGATSKWVPAPWEGIPF